MLEKRARRNDDIAKRLSDKDPLDGLGCSYKPYAVRLFIQDMKNYYEDYFAYASKHVHFIHFKARSILPNEVVATVEQSLKDQLDTSTRQVDDAIVQCEALMKGNGIMLEINGTPNCSTPLTHTAKVISPLTNRYIQLIEKTDYVMRALDALFLDEVITMEEYNVRRGLFKGYVKRFYYACRSFDEGLRARMDAFELKGTVRGKDDPPAQAKPNGSDAPRAVTRKPAKGRKPAKKQRQPAQAVA
jgi:hypothetical protein